LPNESYRNPATVVPVLDHSDMISADQL